MLDSRHQGVAVCASDSSVCCAAKWPIRPGLVRPGCWKERLHHQRLRRGVPPFTQQLYQGQGSPTSLC
jgi:hypothetical protein